jgi:hypothetical protein
VRGSVQGTDMLDSNSPVRMSQGRDSVRSSVQGRNISSDSLLRTSAKDPTSMHSSASNDSHAARNSAVYARAEKDQTSVRSSSASSDHDAVRNSAVYARGEKDALRLSSELKNIRSPLRQGILVTESISSPARRSTNAAQNDTDGVNIRSPLRQGTLVPQGMMSPECRPTSARRSSDTVYIRSPLSARTGHAAEPSKYVDASSPSRSSSTRPGSSSSTNQTQTLDTHARDDLSGVSDSQQLDASHTHNDDKSSLEIRSPLSVRRSGSRRVQIDSDTDSRGRRSHESFLGDNEMSTRDGQPSRLPRQGSEEEDEHRQSRGPSATSMRESDGSMEIRSPLSHLHTRSSVDVRASAPCLHSSDSSPSRDRAGLGSDDGSRRLMSKSTPSLAVAGGRHEQRGSSQYGERDADGIARAYSSGLSGSMSHLDEMRRLPADEARRSCADDVRMSCVGEAGERLTTEGAASAWLRLGDDTWEGNHEHKRERESVDGRASVVNSQERNCLQQHDNGGVEDGGHGQIRGHTDVCEEDDCISLNNDGAGGGGNDQNGQIHVEDDDDDDDDDTNVRQRPYTAPAKLVKKEGWGATCADAAGSGKDMSLRMQVCICSLCVCVCA